MAKLPRVVNDTNVWLSALYLSGKPAQIVNLVEQKKILSVSSHFILDEMREKMVVNFHTPSFAANGTVAYTQSISELAPLKGRDFGLRNSADNQVLETAVLGKCHWLITGDNDLLTLKRYDDINIVKPKDFLDLYDLRKILLFERKRELLTSPFRLVRRITA